VFGGTNGIHSAVVPKPSIIFLLPDDLGYNNVPVSHCAMPLCALTALCTCLSPPPELRPPHSDRQHVARGTGSLAYGQHLPVLSIASSGLLPHATVHDEVFVSLNEQAVSMST
jgi:hypothetical protein